MPAAPKKTMRSPGIFSVFAKITLISGVSALIFATLMSWLSNNAATERAKTLTQETARFVTPMVSDQIVGALRFGKSAPAQTLIEEALAATNGQAEGAVALDGKGASFAQDPGSADVPELTRIARSALETGTPTQSTDGFSYAVPIFSGKSDAPIGALAMQWTPKFNIATAHADALRVIKLTGLIALACLGIVAGLAIVLITRPLTRVHRAVSNVAAGALSDVISDQTRRDEIGAIARALDSFRASLAQAEQGHREAHMHSTALDCSTVAVILTDKDQVITYANDAATTLLAVFEAGVRLHNPEFDTKALIGARADQILPDDGSGAPMDSTSHEVQTHEGRLPEGTLRAIVSPVLDESGGTIGYVWEWRDVTEDMRNASLIAAIDTNLLRVDLRLDATIDRANEGFATILGKPLSTLPGHSLSKRILYEGQPVCAHMRKNKTALSGQFILTCESGDEAILEGSANPIFDAKGEMVMFSLLASDQTAITREREARAAAAATTAADQRHVVDALRAGLTRLSEGKLSQSIDEDFPSEYESLRHDFNRALGDLCKAMVQVLENADSIRAETSQINSSSEDMARRTEQQAATLEQTAAALNQITSSVEAAAKSASHANQLVEAAKRHAEQSGEVVNEAVQAMSEIEQSSDKISSITSVIDEIAFQTNLLALNAGVEAARAGEAGRGFAVVASEVRALAQRSSDAAREIADLIESSSLQVKRGVGLVGQAGEALGGIQTSVGDILTYVADSANATQEQSAGLSEVNSAVTQLDQVTQQNAAMFEEALAASHSLDREADMLTQTMARFDLGQPARIAPESTARLEQKGAAPKQSAPAKATTPAPSFSSARAAGKTAQAVKSAPLPAPAADDWEDF
ncbi:chemotaxis protein [Thioclava dalianensis]|uniref:Chemotaxis protein n=1 Tax=Thioclava dalianensis TaxID=1185766 RepID=A0A074TGS7_9RHOB|nr:methyl-accepting chemotaxis protein [Thioclava dalianensis]KEP70864.1 chemotaxis protein [Thioclava dalianensis]SFN12680.1 methyl-accepting chemotaxis protein [Thioclava dalianensis]